MTLPVLEDTWVHGAVNQFFLIDHSTGLQEFGARNLFLMFHYMLTDKVLGQMGGDFADQGGNVCRFTQPGGVGAITQSDGPWTNYRKGLFIASDVGREIFFAGATSAANDGYFTITAVDGAGTWCEFTNAAVVTEALPATSSYTLLKGSWASLPNGRTPWRVNYCCASSASAHGCGVADDLIDRFQGEGDYDSNTSGNRSWVVWENVESGVQILMYMETSSSSSQWLRSEMYLNSQAALDPYTGGDLTGTRPSSALDVFIFADTTDIWGDTSPVNREWFFNLQMTDDGLSTHFWAGRDNDVFWGFMDKNPKDPTADGGVGIPWDGNKNALGWATKFLPGSIDGVFGHGNWHDISWLWSVLDPNGNHVPDPGPHDLRMYCATELYIASSSAQQQLLKDDVAGEFMFWPIGLVGTTGSAKGRMARIADMFWTNSNNTFPLLLGATFPGDGSRQFVKVNDMILPWNGDKYRKQDGD